MSTAEVLVGDCREVLRTLPAGSVHCVVTSPPYYGLRDYGVAGQIGLEESPSAYIATMVEVFREVWRVLRDDGCVFLNLGDSYYGAGYSNHKNTGGASRSQGGKQRHMYAYGADAPERDSGDTAIPDCQCRDCASGNPCDAHIDAVWHRIARIYGRPVPRPVLESLLRILGCTGALLGHLPSGDYLDQIPTAQFSDATLGLAQSVLREVAPLLSSLESTQIESLRLLPEGSRLSNSFWACRASIHSCVAYARLCARTLGVASDSTDCKEDIAELYAGLAHHIRCTEECCLSVLAWLNTPHFQPHCTTLKPKDLMMMPHRVAIALQDAGWWVRSAITWCKPNCMPESVQDRPTSATEMLFLLAKAPTYYYDAEAIAEPATEFHRAGKGSRMDNDRDPKHGTNKQDAVAKRTYMGFNERWDNNPNPPTKRNKRNWWVVASQPYSEAHFATFPEALVEPCILAGSSARGCCPACGAPWRRVVEREASGAYLGDTQGKDGALRNDTAKWAGRIGEVAVNTLGWEPTCTHNFGEPIPCTVLDPFLGSGTVAKVAIKHGRRCVGIELNPAYVGLAEERAAGVQMSFRTAVV